MAHGLALLLATTIHCFTFSTAIMIWWLWSMGARREKSREARWRSTEEQKPVWEMERAVDVDLFLEAQKQWAKDSPNCLFILHEMFLHAESLGWKEAEWVVCWGCWQHIPKLDPEVGTPAVQLVHPDIEREQLLNLYLEVYKLHRLPGSPPGEPAILEEISSIFPCPSSEEKDMPDFQRLPSPKSLHSPWCGPSLQEWEDSIDRSIARVCKAYWKALLMAATLEEEIERLCRKKAHSSPEWRQRDSYGSEERSRKRRCRASFGSQPTTSWSADPGMLSSRTGSEDRDSDLGDLPQLQAEVASFLQCSSKTAEEDSEGISPESPVSQPTEWVWWKAERCDIPDWYAELSTVPLEDTEKLAQQVRASFKLPKCMHELNPKEAPFHAPPAPPCLHWWKFLPPITSAFACQDIWEIPREKTIAYARAMQCFAEWHNLPRKDQPCPLAKSMIKLREEVKFYLSFMDEEVFQGVDLPEKDGDKPLASTATATDPCGATAAEKTLPTWKVTPAYAGWDTVLHLSWPVMVTGEVPPPTTALQAKWSILWPIRTIPSSPPPKTPKASSLPKSPPPAKALALVRPPTLPCGFARVTTCLRTLELEEVDQDTPASVVTMGVVSGPGMSSICLSWVVRDDKKGLWYLEHCEDIHWMDGHRQHWTQRGPDYRGCDGQAVRTLKERPAVRREEHSLLKSKKENLPWGRHSLNMNIFPDICH